MMYFEIARLIYAANSKGWARYTVGTACSAGQTSCECGLSTTKVTDKLNDLTALQALSEPLCELFGSLGAGGIYLPSRDGTHMPRIVARMNPPLQA